MFIYRNWHLISYSKEGVILNSYAINVTLGQYATFWWGILDANQTQLGQGNLLMQGEDYAKWGANDSYAWEFVANTLNLTIIGDYVPPTPAPTTDTSGTSGTSGTDGTSGTSGI